MKKPGRPSFRPRVNRSFSASAAKAPGSRAEWYGDNWNEISRYVRQRDNFTCRIQVINPARRCGLYCPPPYHSLLHVHHIVPLPRGSNHPKNLITLCKECHGWLHNKNLGSLTDKQRRVVQRKKL